MGESFISYTGGRENEGEFYFMCRWQREWEIAKSATRKLKTSNSTRK